MIIFMIKPIFLALSSNTEPDDFVLAQDLFNNPSNHEGDHCVEQLIDCFKDYLGAKEVFAFDSGRSALYRIVQSFNLPKGAGVMVPGFTCAAAVNPLIWAGLKPVFVDIDQSLNINQEDLVSKIRPGVKVVLAQHTFGLPLDMDFISRISQENELLIIEDCAHSLGASWRGKLTGSWGQASFFSFGRDKIISSVFGGLAVLNDQNLVKTMKRFRKNTTLPSKKWIRQQLKHPLLVEKWIKPLYGYGEIGRKMLLFLQKTGWLSKSMTREEKRGQFRPAKAMPEAMAALALNQFLKLDKFNLHRQEIADFYRHELSDLPLSLPSFNSERVYLKFPVILPDKDMADKFIHRMRAEKIYLYDGWRGSPIVPADTCLTAMKYLVGDCPTAEDICQRLVNLPTHININLSDAERMTKVIKQYFYSL